MTRPKILVIRGGAIGDFILTIPAISALRQRFPQAHLEVLGYPHIVQLAVAGGLVDRAQPIEARGLAAFFARNGELSEDMRDYFSEFEIILSYLYDPDEIFAENIRRCAHGQYIAGPHRPDEKGKLHATRVFLKPLERLAIFDPDPVPALAVDAIDSAQPTLALHPGSGSDAKNWPQEKWAELIDRLIRTTQWNLLLVGGEAEEDRLQKLAAGVPYARCRVAQSLPLTELAGWLRSCIGFVGHDSGITHLAAALDLPCLVLWAHTPEEVWRPQGKKLAILRDANGIRHITVQRVMDELQKLMVGA